MGRRFAQAATACRMGRLGRARRVGRPGSDRSGRVRRRPNPEPGPSTRIASKQRGALGDTLRTSRHRLPGCDNRRVLVIGDIAWWGPLAIIGGALVGLVVGYVLLAAQGAPRSGGPVAERLRFERTDKTNYPRPNLAAMVVLLAVIGLVVGLSVGLSAE